MPDDNTPAPAPEAQSPAAATPPVEPIQPSLSHEEQLDNLSPDSTEAAIALLSPDRPKKVEDVNGGEQPAPQAEAAPAPAEAPPVDPAATTPPVDPEDAKPGRIRIGRIADERTRRILEFQSRNHDATIEDAIDYVDGQIARRAPAPAPSAQTGPDLGALEGRVADLTKALATASDKFASDFDAAKVAALTTQLLDAKLDVRDARRELAGRETSAQAQRLTTREQSVARALELCPEIDDPQTPQGQEFTRLFKQYEARGASILNDDDCAETIAARVMIATGYTPKTVTAAAADAPVTPAPAAPRTPIPVVRNTPPASVSAPGSARLTPAPAVNSAALLKDIDESDDVSGYVAAMTKNANSARKPFSLD